MRKVLTVLLWGAAGVAAADPKPPQCVPGDLSGMQMFGAGGRAIVCWSATSGCIALDDDQVVPRPAPDPRPASVRDADGKPAACNAKTCKPLGTRLAAAVAAAGKAATVTVTTGLELVAIDGGATHALWNVAQDKPLAPKQPAAIGKGEHAELARVEAVGAHAFATWSTCGGGPCSMEIVVEPSGGNRSKAFAGGDTVALANGTYAVMGGNTIQILDATGRHAGKLDVEQGGVGTDGSAPTMVGLGNNEVVVLSAYLVDKDYRTFVHAKISSAGKGTLGKRGKIPTCTE